MTTMIAVYVKNFRNVSLGVAYQGEEVFATSFSPDQERTLKGVLDGIPFNMPFQRTEKASAFADRAISILKKVYDGEDVAENFSLNMKHLSSYAQKVLRTTSLIPTGYAASYGSVAKVAGGSPRGVGRVMALNPFAPIVPCHRVVGSDFTLVGYGGGVDTKLRFLEREKRGFKSAREISVDGKKLAVFPVEFVLEKVKKKV